MTKVGAAGITTFGDEDAAGGGTATTAVEETGAMATAGAELGRGIGDENMDPYLVVP